MNILKKSALLTLFLFPISIIFSNNEKRVEHEFHISKCQIEYNEQEKSLQITIHLFIDDLETALRQKGADKLFICTEKENKKAEEYIYKYLQQKFKISIEDKALKYSFIGKEMSEDLIAVWCYLEVKNIQPFKKLLIKNDILTETFGDQKNIISIIIGPNKNKGYFLFDKNKNEGTVNF